MKNKLQISCILWSTVRYICVKLKQKHRAVFEEKKRKLEVPRYTNFRLKNKSIQFTFLLHKIVIVPLGMSVQNTNNRYSTVSEIWELMAHVAFCPEIMYLNWCTWHQCDTHSVWMQVNRKLESNQHHLLLYVIVCPLLNNTQKCISPTVQLWHSYTLFLMLNFTWKCLFSL